ncbi:MAG TPA: DUF4388 domain-containing protein [Anaeromyxobacter sp.]|nr:DUF4388 domain-containing protein [Anaeromyxobacter sp.]
MPESLEPAAAGLELVDVIQLKGVSWFSGCISVAGEAFTGLIFFRDGQIIHAEAGSLVGEEAFYAIAQRRNTTFTLQPNVTTTSHSIHRSWQFLLMESQRLLDEARRRGPVPVQQPPVPEKRLELVDRIRRVPGVVWAALESKAGARPGGEAADPNEERTAQLGDLARVVGDRLRVGEVVGATVQGGEKNLLLMATKAYHLVILVQGGPQAAATEAEIRKLLAARR